MAVDYEALAKEFGGVRSDAPTQPTPLTPAAPAPIDYEALAKEFGGKKAQDSITPVVEGGGGAAFGVFPRPGIKTPLTEPKKPIEVAATRDFTALDTAIQTLTPKPKVSTTVPVEGFGRPISKPFQRPEPTLPVMRFTIIAGPVSTSSVATYCGFFSFSSLITISFESVML